MKASISEVMRSVEKCLVELEEKPTREFSRVDSQGYSIEARREVVASVRMISVKVEVLE